MQIWGIYGHAYILERTETGLESPTIGGACTEI